MHFPSQPRPREPLDPVRVTTRVTAVFVAVLTLSSILASQILLPYDSVDRAAASADADADADAPTTVAMPLTF